MTRAGTLPALAARSNRGGTQYSASPVEMCLATEAPPPSRSKRETKPMDARKAAPRVDEFAKAEMGIAAGARAAIAAMEAGAAVFVAATTSAKPPEPGRTIRHPSRTHDDPANRIIECVFAPLDSAKKQQRRGIGRGVARVL